MLTFSHDPYDGRIYYKEAKSLSKFGYDVSILSLIKSNKQATIDDNIKVIYVEVYHVNIFILWLLKLIRLFREALKINADVYHCHEPESFLVGVAIKLWKRKKLILDVHEYYRDLISISGRYYKYYYFIACYVLDPILCRLVDYIICADNTIASLYSKYNKNIVILNNYPIVDTFKDDKNHIRDSNKIIYTLIYTGAISEIRGIWLMLDTVRDLVKSNYKVKLILVGDCSTVLKDNIDKYIITQGLDAHVNSIGTVPHPEVYEYMKSADIGLLLYQPILKFFKNIPTKQYEYAVAGLPFIGTNLPPIKEFIDDARCGILVQPNDVQEVVKSIIYIVDNPDKAIEMGENGKKAVYNKYNWEQMETKLLNIYSSI